MILPDDVSTLCAQQFWRVDPTGSNWIVPNHPLNKDEDWLIQVYDSEESVRFALMSFQDLGFTFDSHVHYQQLAFEFMSFKRNNVNLIVTRDPTFATKWRAATNICKRLAIELKPQRIAIFRAALYNEVEPIDITFSTL